MWRRRAGKKPVTAIMLLRLCVPALDQSWSPKIFVKSLCSTEQLSFDQIAKTTAAHAYATNIQN
jgi:hypothetical protein